ncbi:dehydrogenase, partial [Candidatus Pelagibacter sp.]|nr:dehydrogenase [Candidatus Pelagibacter sp.]
MNKLSLLILILLFINNCSKSKKQSFWGKDKSKVEQIENVEKILTKQLREEQEFNPTLKIKISKAKFNQNYINNQNNIGESSYEGKLEKIGMYKFSKFNDFDHIDV